MARPPALLDLGGASGDEDTDARGNFSPVHKEQDLWGPFPMEGSLPAGLSGLLVRNGPNPGMSGEIRRRWADGDGMLHALRLEDGSAAWYKNRWVRTRRLAGDLGVSPRHGPAQPVDGPANTNVLWHAGRLLALCGTGLPQAVTPELATIGLDDFGGMLSSPMGAHPKVDPVTGGLTFVGHDPFGPPYLRYHELDAGGALVHSTDVAVPRPTLNADIGVTATHVVFVDGPLLLCGPAPAAGLVPDYRWTPEVGARLGVLARGADGVHTTWIAVDPRHVTHVVNAFDERRSVVLDVTVAEQAGGAGAPPAALLPRLERWRIHPASGEVDRTPLYDAAVELPAVDPLLAGRPYRHAYCVELGEGPRAGSCHSLVQFDTMHGEARVHRFPGGSTPGAPCFVRAPDGDADDEGWVLSLVHDTDRGACDLVILDASDFAGPPAATVHLPVRVPFGLHGCWVPAARLR